MPTNDLPRIGFGTYSSDDQEQWTENVRTALDAGYRAVDTAHDYRNEQYVVACCTVSKLARIYRMAVTNCGNSHFH